MTDLSSEKNDMAEMAGELMQAKMDAARQNTQMTHVLRVGSFHMEIVPDKDIDVEKMFKETMSDLYEKFGDKLLSGSIEQPQRQYG